MEVNPQVTSKWIKPIATCILLLVTYVGSLYMWKSNKPRRDPNTIKQRFISVFITSIIAPGIVYFSIDDHLLEKWSLATLVGIRLEGLGAVLVLPLLLTSSFYLGPLFTTDFSDIWELYTDSTASNVEFVEKLTWWRNYVVGPLTEELVFRACMLPVLLQAFSPSASIFISSFFFGIAHIHHFYERLRAGYPLFDVILMTAFQCSFTTVFGMYSAYLFVRTGHLLAACLVHSFCNFMGIPDLQKIWVYHESRYRRYAIGALYGAGVILWLLLLQPLTKPELYSNDLFWVTQ